MMMALILVGYILGSIPTGYITVRIMTGRDVRTIQSGPTGGTNAMRGAGIKAGLITAFGDVSKAIIAVWLAKLFFPEVPLLHVLVGLAAVIGHNYSLFLIERKDGTLKFGGGAGGAPTVGAAVGLWAPIGLIMIPVGALILFLVGYASVTTMTAGITATIVFLLRGLAGADPMVYLLFGLCAEILLLWALRPNIKRLIAGEERLVGLRAKNFEGHKASH